MDLIQYGESSQSPSVVDGHNPNETIEISVTPMDGSEPRLDGARGIPREDIETSQTKSQALDKQEQSKLILPIWDVPPQKALHASLDLISLLHLDTLYNTYVRPFADPVAHDDDGGGAKEEDGGTVPKEVKEEKGKKGKGGGQPGQQPIAKKRRLEKGYEHLLEDCIDPTPLGVKGVHASQALLPLIPEFSSQPVVPAQFWTEELVVLDKAKFMVAKLETGTKVEGYAQGEKIGVRAAELKRQKKRASRLSQAPEPPDPSIPTPPILETILQPPLSTGSPHSPIPHISPPLSSANHPFAQNPPLRGGSTKLPFPVNTTRPTNFAPLSSNVRGGYGTPRGGRGRGGYTPGQPGRQVSTPGRQSVPPNLSPAMGNVPLKRPFNGPGTPGGLGVKRAKGLGGSRSASPIGPGPGSGAGGGTVGGVSGSGSVDGAAGVRRVFKPGQRGSSEHI